MCLLASLLAGVLTCLPAAARAQLCANPCQDADLVTIEYTFNDNSTAPMASLDRRSYEHVVRQLLWLGSRPAVILLNHYSWWVGKAGETVGLFYKEPEAQLTVFSHVSAAVLPGLAFLALVTLGEGPPACISICSNPQDTLHASQAYAYNAASGSCQTCLLLPVL